jgi:hypothetical protein
MGVTLDAYSFFKCFKQHSKAKNKYKVFKYPLAIHLHAYTDSKHVTRKTAFRTVAMFVIVKTHIRLTQSL